MSTPPNRDSTVTTFPHSSHYSESTLPRKRRDSITRKIEKRRIKHYRPITPPLQPATHPPSSSQQGHELLSTPSATQQQSSTDASQFKPIITEDQAGDGIVAHRVDPQFPLVFLKKRPKSGSATGCLLTTRHPNLVNLLAFFEHEHAMSLVYECMQVSLSQIQVSPYSPFAEYELAAVCKEVLQGLLYIHTELKVGHQISCNDVLLSLQGDVKIGNVGDSLLRCSPTSREDWRSIGTMLVELIEPCTRLSDPFSLQLKTPENWGEHLRDFLIQSGEAEGALLIQVRPNDVGNEVKDQRLTAQKHDFLKKSPGPHCLIPHVWVGLRSIRKRGDFLTTHGNFK